MKKVKSELNKVSKNLSEIVTAIQGGRQIASGLMEELLHHSVPTDILRTSEAILGKDTEPWSVYEFYRLYVASLSRSLLSSRQEFPAGSPLGRLVEQHGALLGVVLDHFALVARLARLDSYGEAASILYDLRALDGRLIKDLEYFSWEESAVYPYLERHGVILPSGVVHREQMRIREAKQELLDIVQAPGDQPYHDYVQRLGQVSRALATILLVHFSREVNVVFPEAVEVLQAPEWKRMGRELEELEQCRIVGDFVSPSSGIHSSKADMALEADTPVMLENGQLTASVLSLLLNAIPADLTFIDANDIFRFYNRQQEPLFARSAKILGRPLADCHPPAVMAAVNDVIGRLKNGDTVVERFTARGSQRIRIRYFAVRDKQGRYRGCLEVAEDITDAATGKQ